MEIFIVILVMIFFLKEIFNDNYKKNLFVIGVMGLIYSYVKYPEYTIAIIIVVIVFVIILIYKIGFSKLFFGYTRDPRFLPDNEIYSFTDYKDGQQYSVDIAVKNFPIIAALNLKGKKHEWLIVGFEKENRICLVYSHKGYNNYEVHGISNWLLSSIIEDIQPTSILVFHNHPNGVIEASSEDIKSARVFNKELKEYNIKLHAFVCARGEFKQYF